jgi:hypothetical protein
MFFECAAEVTQMQQRDVKAVQPDVPSVARQTALDAQFLDWRSLPAYEMHPQHRAILERWSASLAARDYSLFHIESDADEEAKFYQDLTQNTHSGGEREMIDWKTVSEIASTAASAVGIVDKVLTRIKEYHSAAGDPRPDPERLKINDSPSDRQLVLSLEKSELRIPYSELETQLNGDDLRHIEAIRNAISSNGRKWDGIYEQMPAASLDERVRLELVLDKIEKDIERDSERLLNFVRKRLSCPT